MRFTTIVLSGAFAAIAVAQSSAGSSNPSPVASLTPAQSSTAACLEECEAGDVDCQADCVHVPSVTEDQVNANTECSRECDQGDGSPEQTEAFGQCLAACVQKNYFISSVGSPEPTGGAGSGSGSGSGNSSSDEDAATTGGAATTGATAGGSNTSASAPSPTESDDSDAAQSSASEAAESGASQTSSAPAASGSPEEEDSSARTLVGSGIFALVAAIFAL